MIQSKTLTFNLGHSVGNALHMTKIATAALLLMSYSEAALTNQSDLKSIGQSTAYWASIIPVYDASLHVSDNTNRDNLLSEQTTIQLELCYRTSLTAENFIEAANEALPENLSPSIQTAVDNLHMAYQDVKKSDCYLLSYTPQTGTELRLNQQLKFSDNTPGFKSTYFGIWLGEQPLSQSVKDELLDSL